MKIPLPTLLRGWRDRAWRDGLEPTVSRAAIGVWRFLALRPGLYRLATRLALPAMRLFARRGWIASMPLAGGWTRYRDFPAPGAPQLHGSDRKDAAMNARDAILAAVGGASRPAADIAREAAALLDAFPACGPTA